MLVVALAAVLLYRIGQTLTYRPDVRPADVIVVLGGEWPKRIERAAALFQQGLAPQIWITGARNRGSTASMSVDLARRAGVPADAIAVLSSGNTWEDASVVVAGATREHVRSILLVTSWYHSRRALCVVRQRFSGSTVAVFHDTVPNAQYDQDSWWRYSGGWFRVAREAAAFLWYWAYHGLAPWDC